MNIQHYNKKIFDWLERNVDRYDLTGRFARGTAAVDESVLLALMEALDKNVTVEARRQVEGQPVLKTTFRPADALRAAEHEMMKRAADAFDRLSPEEQAEIREKQSESWVRGEMGLDR